MFKIEVGLSWLFSSMRTTASLNSEGLGSGGEETFRGT